MTRITMVSLLISDCLFTIPAGRWALGAGGRWPVAVPSAPIVVGAAW